MQRFEESIGKILQAGDLIIQWQIDSAVLVFYAGRPVSRFGDPAKLLAYFLESQVKHVPLYAVLAKAELPGFSGYFENDVLINQQNKRDPENELVLVKLTALKSGD